LSLLSNSYVIAMSLKIMTALFLFFTTCIFMQHSCNAVSEVDLTYLQHFNTVFIDDIQEDLKRYHLQSTFDNGDGALTTVSTRSDMQSLFADAMLSVRSSPIDYEALESLLDTYDDRAFDINNRDKYGNTLLLLACQQGGISKRICKLLLRRGADINAQNYMGNTALHYLMTYNQSPALAEYMIQRGADDSLLNYDGLTCYEGLSKEDVDDME
jgi:ankyrin repeat protein